MALQLDFRDHLRPGVKSDHQFSIESGSFLKHEVDGSAELIGQDSVAFKFTMFGYEHFGIGCKQRMIPFTDDGGLAEGPAQVGIAHFPAAEAFDFSGTGNGAFDQAAVAAEILNGWKPVR